MARYDRPQRRNLRIGLDESRGLPRRVRRALLMAMLVESNARHLSYGDRDSQGILQQRPSMGWGPFIPGARGVRIDIRQFLRPAQQLLAQGFQGGPGRLAQAVQRSAFPDRYGERRGEVASIIRRMDTGRGGRRGGGGGGGRGASGQGQDVAALLALLQQGTTRMPFQALPTRTPQSVLQSVSPLAPETPAATVGAAPRLTPAGLTVDEQFDQLKNLRRALLGIG